MEFLGIKLSYFVIAAGAAVIWVLLREFNCWYWKINDRLLLLEEIPSGWKGWRARASSLLLLPGRVSPRSISTESLRYFYSLNYHQNSG
jgi:hypothetical protein